MLRLAALAGAVLALALASAAPAWSQASETEPPPEPEGWAYAYFGEIMSPYCPGRTLASCPSPQADSLRMWILVQEAAGRSKEDVHEELLERHGDVILAAPRASGFGVAAYAIPAAIFVAGGLLVVVFLRRQTRAAAERAAEAPPSGPLDPEIERLIDEELAR